MSIRGFEHLTMQDAEAKLRRAYENLHLLRCQERAVLEATKDPIAVEFDRSSGWWVAKLGVIEEPPPDLGVLIGDIAYQCLSAFNLIVWELAARKVGRRRVATPQFRNHVQLPIALVPKAFADNPLVTRRLVSKPAIAVLNRLQPYEEGHGPVGPSEHHLPLIKEIADSDKHRVITGILYNFDLSAHTLQWNADLASDPTVEPLLDEDRRTIFGQELSISRIRFGKGNSEADVKVNGQPNPALRFKTDNWTVAVADVSNMLNWAYSSLFDFAPLFEKRWNQRPKAEAR